jgi:hypothetical protein
MENSWASGDLVIHPVWTIQRLLSKPRFFHTNPTLFTAVSTTRCLQKHRLYLT